LLPAVAATTAAATTVSAATTTATSTIAATTASAPIATTTAAALGLGAGFVDVDGAPANLATVEGCDRFFAVFVAGHLDKTETAGAAGIAIGHDAHTVHLSVTFEKLPELILTGIEAEVSYKDILHASSPALSCRKCELSSRTGRMGRPS